MRFSCLLFVAVSCLFGCTGDNKSNPYATSPSGKRGPSDPYAVGEDMIKFVDGAKSNAEFNGDLLSLEFTDRNGEVKLLKDLAQGKNLILVITRGYAGSICPYCSTQVARLIANYKDFEQRNTQIVVVYPLEKPDDAAKADEFVNKVVAMLAAKTDLPFPILLDSELKAVDALGIRRDLSKPATYLLDSEGRLQFAYVGNSLADRPSVQSLLEQLDHLNTPGERS